MIQYKEANSGLMRVNVCMRVATFVCLHPFAQGCVLLAPSEMDPHLASLGSGAVWVELTELEDRVAVRLYHRPDASDLGHGWWFEVGGPRLIPLGLCPLRCLCRKKTPSESRFQSKPLPGIFGFNLVY